MQYNSEVMMQRYRDFMNENYLPYGFTSFDDFSSSSSSSDESLAPNFEVNEVSDSESESAINGKPVTRSFLKAPEAKDKKQATQSDPVTAVPKVKKKKRIRSAPKLSNPGE